MLFSSCQSCHRQQQSRPSLAPTPHEILGPMCACFQSHCCCVVPSIVRDNLFASGPQRPSFPATPHHVGTKKVVRRCSSSSILICFLLCHATVMLEHRAIGGDPTWMYALIRRSTSLTINDGHSSDCVFVPNTRSIHVHSTIAASRYRYCTC